MIFKTQNDELGRMEIKPNQNLLSIFNGDFFKRQQLLSESDIKAIEAYNAEIDKCVGSQTAFYRTMQNTSQEAQNVVAAANGGKVAIGDLTKASKAGELGMKALAMAGNMLVSFLIGSFISVAFEVANASNEIADSAQQIGSSFKETISDLDDYQIKVEDLQETINDSWKDLDDPTDDTFKNTKSDLNTLAKAGQLTQKTFNKVPGAKKWAESFKELGLSTKDVIDRINKMQTASDQLSSMKSGMGH